MAACVFSVNSPNSFKIGYWNIHGVGNKLENKTVLDWISSHHIIFLSELKTGWQFSVPGYVVSRKIEGNNMHRGGVAVLVKKYIRNYLKNIVCDNDQIWINCSQMANFHIGGCYIPPCDSPYFSDLHFAKLQEKLMQAQGPIVLIGDFNSRCGKAVNDLLDTEELPEDVFYSEELPDPVERPNGNGIKILQVCRDTNCVILNNLHNGLKYYKSDKTFRQDTVWISEPDLGVVSSSVLNSMLEFKVDRNMAFPSDHAPISLTLDMSYLDTTVMVSEKLLARASELGAHVVADRNSKNEYVQKRNIKFSDIDKEIFSQKITSVRTEDIQMLETDVAVDRVITELQECMTASRKVGAERSIDPNKSRWNRILESNDDKALWLAINWNGQYMAMDKAEMKPSTEAFKEHFEAILNPESLQELNFEHVHSDVNVPVLDDPFNPMEVDQVIQHQIKANKGSGPDGVCPGLLKLLPVQWVIFLCTLFDKIFYSCYPERWYVARLHVLFKKGQ